MKKKFVILWLCCFDCRRLTDITLTDNYFKFLKYYCSHCINWRENSDYIIVIDCNKGSIAFEGLLEDLVNE